MKKKKERLVHPSPVLPRSSPNKGKTPERLPPSNAVTRKSRVSLWLPEFFDIFKRFLDLAKHYIEHHLKLAILLIIAFVAIAVVAVIVIRPQHLKLQTKHYTLQLDTEIGRIRLDPSKETASAAGLADGLQAQYYTDRRAGFVLGLEKPEDWLDWSIVQAESTVGPEGQPAKAFHFPQGLLTRKETTLLTEDGVVVFLNTKKFRNAKATFFVFHLADRTGLVEDFIEEEVQKGLRTGMVWIVYQLAFFMASPSAKAGLEAAPGRPERVKPTKIVVSPDHMNALLEFAHPHRMYGDIVGRVVVGAKGFYFIVALRIDPIRPEDEIINQQLRTMLESFRPN